MCVQGQGAADVVPLVEVGATVLREPEEGIDWHVLADPEGNELQSLHVPMRRSGA